jgi:hypothetical protein
MSTVNQVYGEILRARHTMAGVGALISTLFFSFLRFPVQGTRHTPLLLVILVSLFVTASSAKAHFDPPGPPPIRPQVIFREFELLRDFDRRRGGSEIFLSILMVHQQDPGTHTPMFQTAFSGFFVDFPTQKKVSPNDIIFEHSECTPHEPLSVSVKAVELDSADADDILEDLGDAAAGIATAFADIGAGIITSVVTGAFSLPASLDGTDFVGRGEGLVPASGSVTIDLRPRVVRVAAKVILEGQIVPLPDQGQCKVKKHQTDQPPDPLPPPQERTDSIYLPLQSALVLIPQVRREPRARYLTEERIANIRQTLMEVILGTAEAAAGVEINDVADLQGVQEAIKKFQIAQTLATTGDAERALTAYSEAFLLAAIARENEQPGPAFLLPFQIVLVPGFLSTKPRIDATVPLVLLGLNRDQAVDAIDVVGQPDGVEISVTEISPGIFTMELDVGDVLPGVYPLHITAQAGMQQAQEMMTLIINPRRR